MPYDAVANNKVNPLNSLNIMRQGQQQQFDNALATRQQNFAEQESQQRQNLLAQRQQQEQGAGEQQAVREFVIAGVENLEAVSSNPAQFAQVADVIAAHPIAQKLGITRDQITPQSIAQLRAQMGVAPGKPQSNDPGPLETIIGPDGRPVLKPRSEAVGQRPFVAPKSGMRLTTPDGTTFQMGDGGEPVSLGKPTQNKLEEAFTNSQANAMALSEQVAKWDPSFSTYGGQLQSLWSGIKAKSGVNLSQQETKFQQDFGSWASDTNSLLNQYLNQLSGAAISPSEEKRLRNAFPNTDDDPVTYQSKAKATMRRFALVQARTGYLLSHPELKLDSVSIDGMQGVMLTEANKLASAYEQKGITDAKARAIQETRKRYGLESGQ